MSALWTAGDAAAATGGHIAGDWQASGVSIDTRTLRAGDLFIAVQGSRDGHAFVADALAKGAAAAMVSRPVDGVSPDKLLLVEDTQAALEALGAAGRRRSTAQIVGITGSVGKTGAKAALAHGLARFGATQASAKSFNNHLGVPVSLARLRPSTRFGVFEMGMNRAGEIRNLTKQVRPHGALITAIAPAHIEFFDDESGIARAKAEIFEGVEADGFAVIPADNVHSDLLRAAARASGIRHLRTFGRGGEVSATDVETDPAGSTVEAVVDGRRLRYRIGLAGRHWVTNSLGLVAVVLALGLDVETFAASLADLRAEPGRGRVHAIALPTGKAVLIDDSYNANPASMRAAFEVLALAPARKLAALGEMRELGADSETFHAALAAPLVTAGVTKVFTAGRDMRHLAEALPPSLCAAHAERAEDLVAAVRDTLRPGDTLLVKGSLASGMGTLVRSLIGEAG